MKTQSDCAVQRLSLCLAFAGALTSVAALVDAVPATAAQQTPSVAPPTNITGAQTTDSPIDLSQMIVSSDALGDGWTLASQGPDDALSALPPRPLASYGGRYTKGPLTANVALYEYVGRATALASPGFSDPSIYWGHGNTSFADLSAYGDGPSYRAYAPGKGATSGITFVDGTVVAFVSVDGFDSTRSADSVANQLASAVDDVLQAGAPFATAQPDVPLHRIATLG